MAQVIGNSDAWGSVCLTLNRASFKPRNPSEIHHLFETTKKEYISAKAKATESVQSQIEKLRTGIEQQEKDFDTIVKSGRDKISADIETVQLTLQLFQVGLFKKLLNYFKIRKQKNRIRLLKISYSNYPKLIQGNIDLAKATLERTISDFDTIIEKQCQPVSSKVKLLENVLKSPEFAGAIAELELIESLMSLPDNYFIINDIVIKPEKAIYFNGEWLQSAQVDHVVVAPSGIFVVEVKNWSKQFVEEGNYFDPYQQVKRASYLCYKLIGERYNLKTRSIIAHKGSIPIKPPNSYTKALSINEVKSYISRFKEPCVSDEVARTAASWFAHHSSRA